MPPENSRKVGCEFLIAFLGLFVAAISVAAALYANAQSGRAIQIAIEANNLVATQNAVMQQVELPRFSVQQLYTYRAFSDNYKQPCVRSDGEGYWRVDLGIVFDISNLGSKAISLVDVNREGDGTIETFIEKVEANVWYKLFETRDDFLAWLTPRGAPFGIDMTKQNFVFSALPVVFSPGETKRLILWAEVTATISKDIIPEQFQENSYLLPASWVSDVSFVFAGDIIETLTVPLQRPYELDPANIHVDAFEPCDPSD